MIEESEVSKATGCNSVSRRRHGKKERDDASFVTLYYFSSLHSQSIYRAGVTCGTIMPIICEKWNGHRGPISCLDSSEEEVVMMMEEGDGGCSSSSSSSSSGRTSHRSLLLSGSEDKTARLWDLRENSIGGSSTSSSNPRRRASLCISAPGEIFNVKFAPKIPKRNHPQEEASTALSSPFAKDHSMYVTSSE